MSRRSATKEQVEAADDVEAIASNADTLTDNNFAVPGHLSSGAITRHFAVEFAGSLAEMADSPSLASWSPTELSIFQSRTRYAPNCAKSEFRQGNLQQAILSKCCQHPQIRSVFMCCTNCSTNSMTTTIASIEFN